MCEFQQLYFDDDGYIVRCRRCGHYQVGFAGIILTLTANEFATLCKIVARKCMEEHYCFPETARSITIPTPCRKVTMLLTRKETLLFNEILEKADTEAKALTLISMFNS